jgi:hypothetical protein
MLYLMAGIRGRSGPPGNENAFRHGLAGIAQRRAEGVLTNDTRLAGGNLPILISTKAGKYILLVGRASSVLTAL